VLDHGLNAARGSSSIGWNQHAFEHASS
jgi:hypothetical protein